MLEFLKIMMDVIRITTFQLPGIEMRRNPPWGSDRARTDERRRATRTRP